MAPVTAVHSAGEKKRKPPTFHHLPRARAEKLKRSWVETKKIKGKWRAEKRKLLGLTPQNREQDNVQDETLDAMDDDKDSWKGIDKDDSASGRQDDSEPSEAEGKDENEGVTQIPQPEPPKLNHAARRKLKLQGLPTKPADELSLRDLERQAYSPASLHTHKSDPLHRRRGGSSNRRGSSIAERGHAGIRGGGRGRGQPNMRLRMNALVERIKRTA